MYDVVRLRGIVLQEQMEGEYNATYVLYTESLGKIYVRAQSIKKIEAKHRMNIQPFSLVNLDVVRGQGGWRVTGSYLEERFATDVFAIRAMWGRVIRVLLDLTPIEQVDQDLFDVLVAMFRYQTEMVPTSAIPYLEAKVVARVLKILGWWQQLGEFEVHSDPKKFVGAVNQSLQAAYQ